MVEQRPPITLSSSRPPSSRYSIKRSPLIIAKDSSRTTQALPSSLFQPLFLITCPLCHSDLKKRFNPFKILSFTLVHLKWGQPWSQKGIFDIFQNFRSLKKGTIHLAQGKQCMVLIPTWSNVETHPTFEGMRCFEISIHKKMTPSEPGPEQNFYSIKTEVPEPPQHPPSSKLAPGCSAHVITCPTQPIPTHCITHAGDFSHGIVPVEIIREPTRCINLYPLQKMTKTVPKKYRKKPWRHKHTHGRNKTTSPH